MGIARKYYTGPPLPDPTAPGGVFSFADKERLRFVIEQAGFRDIHIDEMDIPMVKFDSGAEFWEYCKEFIGPLRRILDGMSAETRGEDRQRRSRGSTAGQPRRQGLAESATPSSRRRTK